MTASREESTQRKRGQRHRRFAERVLVDGRLVHPNGPHGKCSTYRNSGCRCELCTVAHAQDINERRRQRWASRVPNADGALVAPGHVRHGSPNTYHNWGCQCRPCLDAAAAKARRLHQARREVSAVDDREA